MVGIEPKGLVLVGDLRSSILVSFVPACETPDSLFTGPIFFLIINLALVRSACGISSIFKFLGGLGLLKMFLHFGICLSAVFGANFLKQWGQKT